jgi:hypothetical protein
MSRLLWFAVFLLLVAFPALGQLPFIGGANWPGVYYGDFGCNAWGCRGVSTEGFVAETYAGSDGAHDVFRRKATAADTAALAYDCDLSSQKSCEIYVDLGYVRPTACPQPLNPATPLSVNGSSIRVRICLPDRFQGPSNAPTGFQVFVKSATGSSSWYSNWINLTSSGCQEFVVPVSASFGAVLTGIKLGGNASNPTPLSGRINVERFAIEGAQPMAFDFQSGTVERDFGVIKALANASSAPTAAARVFVFVDGRAGIVWSNGSVDSFDSVRVFRDFDALLDGATAAGVKVIPVLLDFLLLSKAQLVNGVQIGGHSSVINDTQKRRTLLDQVFAPLLRKYGNHPSIAAWEIINEPEWATLGIPGDTSDKSQYDAVQLAQMQDFVRVTAALIRQNSTLPVCIGSARRSWLYLWRDLGLSCYSFHYYDSDPEPFPWATAGQLGLDGPVYAGEVPTDATAHLFNEYLLAGRNGGYNGVLGWSCRAHDQPVSRSDLHKALQLTPLAGATLGPGPVVFSWEAVAGATSYLVRVGTSPGGNDLFTEQTTGTSVTIGGLPSDGRALYVTVLAMVGGSYSAAVSGTYTASNSSPLQFVPVAPCRVADTRNAAGPLGGPSLSSGATRDFPVTSSACGIPASARAYSLNVTAVPRGALGYLSAWPAGTSRPLVSTLNSVDGRIKANAAVVSAGSGGAISVYATDAADVVLDINGYFVSPPTGGSSLMFYPLTPCRVADTRLALGPLGGPAMAAGQSRTFAVSASSCTVPSSASAYSLNFTVVPRKALAYLSTWPTGSSQPLVSTLNAPTGAITANAAIVPAGTGGAIDVYTTDLADVVIDINGYFAPAGAPNALSFYGTAPCRIADTRNAPGALAGPAMGAGESRSFPMNASACNVPAAARAYLLNVTTVPPGSLGYLTLWPTGLPTPLVSTLNSIDGTIVANAALVPAGPDGSISVYVTNPAHVVLDMSGYFAP